MGKGEALQHSVVSGAEAERGEEGGGGFGMTPWCDDLVCSRRRLLANRHTLPFPWTLFLHRRWCPSASHHPLGEGGGGAWTGDFGLRPRGGICIRNIS